MIGVLENRLPPEVTRTTLYHVVRLVLRLYVGSLLVAGVYSLLWVADVAGLIPEALLSTIWIGIAVMGSLFLVLLIPLFYTSRSSHR
ncbi:MULTISPECIES: hypothetical protein [Natrialba]|uniref:Uncharacterized protein n=1 Tax=Natrialba swarupiae TaxID=2448032 RepID=A0A5D5AP40_9EURY|nr:MULTISPECIES: hypothetical protein [Natrialba]MCW8172515.1 hypothetical protein [Natrialba swarupiae]MWV39179.1 hypothetical protein [Natrialba sp. INN-245]TYT63588.1 hypothetical protein FYC77_03145 [Natrialba swarupiae]